MMKVGGGEWYQFGFGRNFKAEVGDIVAGMATLKDPIDMAKTYDENGIVTNAKNGNQHIPMNQLPIFVNLNKSAKQAYIFRKIYKTLQNSKKKVYDDKNVVTEKETNINNITYEQILKLYEIFSTYLKVTDYTDDDFKKFVQMIVDDAAEHSEYITFNYESFKDHYTKKRANYNGKTIPGSKDNIKLQMDTIDGLLSSRKNIPSGSIMLPTISENEKYGFFDLTKKNLFVLKPDGEISNESKFMGTKGGYTLSWDPKNDIFSFVKGNSSSSSSGKTQKIQPAATKATTAPTTAATKATTAPTTAATTATTAATTEPAKGGRRTRKYKKNRY